MSNYSLPSKNQSDWDGHQTSSFIPSARQQIVIEAVRQAVVVERLFYTDEVRTRVAQILEVPKDILIVNTMNVEGGNFGMDVYYARRAIEAQSAHTDEANTRGKLRLESGLDLGCLMFNDYKRCKKTVVLSVTDTHALLEFSRGGRRYQAQVSGRQIRDAIVRSHSSKARKDSYEDFLASRTAQPLALA